MKKLSWHYKKLIFQFKKKIDLDKDLLSSNNLNELFNHYGSDKGTMVNHPYGREEEKIVGHGFGDYYEKYFNFSDIEKYLITNNFRMVGMDLLNNNILKGSLFLANVYYFNKKYFKI